LYIIAEQIELEIEYETLAVPILWNKELISPVWHRKCSNQNQVVEMRPFRQHKQPNKENVQKPPPMKYRYPNLATYDPYLVDIVKMLEQLRNESKH